MLTARGHLGEKGAAISKQDRRSAGQASTQLGQGHRETSKPSESCWFRDIRNKIITLITYLLDCLIYLLNKWKSICLHLWIIKLRASVQK